MTGVLTRGREFDTLFRPRWRTPINMNAREKRRMADAEVLVRELRLAIRETRGKGDRRKAISRNRKAKKEHQKIQGMISQLPSIAEIDQSLDSTVDVTELPDYVRVVGQLAGKITYQVSHKDTARIESMEKFKKVIVIMCFAISICFQ